MLISHFAILKYRSKTTTCPWTMVKVLVSWMTIKVKDISVYDSAFATWMEIEGTCFKC